MVSGACTSHLSQATDPCLLPSIPCRHCGGSGALWGLGINWEVTNVGKDRVGDLMASGSIGSYQHCLCLLASNMVRMAWSGITCALQAPGSGLQLLWSGLNLCPSQVLLQR